MRASSANLDLLRSFAVGTVMIDHLMPTLVRHGIHPPLALQKFFEHIGHAGVLAFFVHTSLVLMYSLERLAAPAAPASPRSPSGPAASPTSGSPPTPASASPPTSGSPPALGSASPPAPAAGSPPTHRALVLRFYLRRFFRIYPLAIVVIIAVVGLRLPDSTWHDPITPSTLEIVANLLLVQNVVTGHSILVPLWSLPYEVEMYLVLPFLYFVARRTDALRWLCLLLAFTYVGAYAFRKLEHGHMNMAAYIPCFLSGVLCYTLRDRLRPRLPGVLWAPVVVGLIALYCYIHLISWKTIYWLGWGFCLVLAFAIPLFHDSTHRLLNAAAQRIATYSYGLYLLHVPALYIVYDLWAPSSIALGLLAYVTLAALGAIAAYHLLEAPMVELGRRLTTPRAPRPA